MEQLEFFDVPSPCIGVCRVNERGYCQGCLRNRDERFRWMEMTPAEKLYVIKLCRMRFRRQITKDNKTSKTVQQDIHPQQNLF
ncbi:hypothetical protein VA7868_04334 [Vibrio aerogenes CECT 7868]|uniref:Fe-S protein n=1 Tax=Vibrio aerogenes CECT 7868 TaxID=1216006 RepID=A0A1M6DWS1_9VIBR|nr:DUF1289 domain-containing protein [Vibrio aerogenes]SHI77478.1 hypothetical protein VA7868_04334 [Vibrio aerogenes CECT 7868]